MSRITHATYLNTTEDPSINTLHQSLEYHLQRLHNEKQEEISLNSQIKSLESKLQLSKQLLQRSVRPSDLSKSLSKLKKKVENTTSQVNLLHNENEQLKSKIDDLRQEGSTFRRVIGQLNENIKDSSFTAKASSQQKLRVRSEEQSNKEKIHQLLNKSTTEKLDFSGKLEKITAGFMNFKKSQLESMKKHSEKLLKLVSRPFSAIDLIPILEKQLESRVMRTETMRKKLKSYKNNCKKIRNGLGKILSAVGRSDYIALAKQFIDSENQMKDVQVYIMNLSSEIDSLSVTNAVMFEGLKKTVTSKGSEIFLSLKKQVTSIKNRVDVLKFKSSVLNNSLLRVETIIDKIFEKFQKIPEKRRTFNVIVDPEADLAEKLSTLENILHHTLIMKAYMSKQHSSFGTLRSSVIRDTADRESGFKTVREMIDHLNISEELGTEESTGFHFLKSSKY